MKEKLTNKDMYGIIWERSIDGIKAGCIIVWCIGQGRKSQLGTYIFWRILLTNK